MTEPGEDTPRGPFDLPPEGDASGGNVSPDSLFVVNRQVSQMSEERRQAYIHKRVYFYAAILAVALFFAALLRQIYLGMPTGMEPHVYLTELGILALIPSAILIRLAAMVGNHGNGDTKEAASSRVPLPSVAVAEEAVKAILEIVKSFRSPG